jgi:hypothetical protein
MIFDDRIIQIAAILIIPLVPAYILYRTLPSSSSVRGPFQGLNVKFKGAFAGYFVLVLVSGSYFSMHPPSANTFEMWRLIGKATFVAGNPAEPDPKFLNISLVPTRQTAEPVVGDTMRFVVDMPVERMPDGTTGFKYDEVYVDYNGKGRQALPIKPEALKQKEHVIEIGTANITIQPSGRTSEPKRVPAEWESEK